MKVSAELRDLGINLTAIGLAIEITQGEDGYTPFPISKKSLRTLRNAKERLELILDLYVKASED